MRVIDALLVLLVTAAAYGAGLCQRPEPTPAIQAAELHLAQRLERVEQTVSRIERRLNP